MTTPQQVNLYGILRPRYRTSRTEHPPRWAKRFTRRHPVCHHLCNTSWSHTLHRFVQLVTGRFTPSPSGWSLPAGYGPRYNQITTARPPCVYSFFVLRWTLNHVVPFRFMNELSTVERCIHLPVSLDGWSGCSDGVADEFRGSKLHISDSKLNIVTGIR